MEKARTFRTVDQAMSAEPTKQSNDLGTQRIALMNEALRYRQAMMKAIADLGKTVSRAEIEYVRMALNSALNDALVLNKVAPEGIGPRRADTAAEIAPSSEEGPGSAEMPTIPTNSQSGEFTMVPNSALRWLFGEEGDFIQLDGKKSRPFWWRSEFRRRIESFRAEKMAQKTTPSLEMLPAKPKEAV